MARPWELAWTVLKGFKDDSDRVLHLQAAASGKPKRASSAVERSAGDALRIPTPSGQQAAIPRICRADPNGLPYGDGYPGLGSISQLYEAEGKGAEFVSRGTNDRGGASVGPYQLSSKTGGWDEFLACEGKYWAPQFGRWRPGAPQFKSIIDGLAKWDAQRLLEDQRDYIIRRSFEPTLEMARKGGVDVNDPATREALWSQSIQAGRSGSMNILRRTMASGVDVKDKGAFLKALYATRTAMNPKDSVRYGKEIREVLDHLAAHPAPVKSGPRRSRAGTTSEYAIPVANENQLRRIPSGFWVVYRGQTYRK